MEDTSIGRSGGPTVIFFDGVCNLCNWLVRFVIRRDNAGQFRFAALQSTTAARLLGASPAEGARCDSVVLLEDGRRYRNSAAVLRIARRLRFPWPVLYVLIAVPKPQRDWLYGRVARGRYRWFGRRSTCMAPPPEMQTRFLP